MLALLGSIAGFLSSLIPEFFNVVRDKRDKRHELEIIRLQIEASKAKHLSRLEEVKLTADNIESRARYHYPRSIGISWVDALAGSVRPFITYSFFLLYIAIKIVIFLGYQVGISMPLWTDEDQGLFSAIMCFWFGSRIFARR